MVHIVVLNHKVHGLQATDYAETLQQRLPDHEITLASTETEKHTQIADADIATGYTITPELIETAENLTTFVCTFAGTDHLPTDFMEDHGVQVESASGVHGPNVAEQVLGYILTFVRRLDKGWRQEQRNEWNHYQAGELMGSTATIVGLGPIGETIAERLHGFDVTTIGVRYTPSKGGVTDEVIGFNDDDIASALTRSDHVILACPLTDETRYLIDRDELSMLPSHATLTNIARGEVVVTDALVEALKQNGIRGAALDVTDPEPLPETHELWSLTNCRITPHNAGHTPEYWERCSDILIDTCELG